MRLCGEGCLQTTKVALHEGPVGIPAGLVSKAVYVLDTWRTQLTLTLTSLWK